jgi:hypothetical protein
MIDPFLYCPFELRFLLTVINEAVTSPALTQEGTLFAQFGALIAHEPSWMAFVSP